MTTVGMESNITPSVVSTSIEINHRIGSSNSASTVGYRVGTHPLYLASAVGYRVATAMGHNNNHYGAIDNSSEYVELIDRLSDAKYDRNRGEYILSFACQKNLPDLVDKMIASGVNVNHENEYDPNCMTPLMSAAEKGHLNVVEKLLSNKADVNFKHFNGNAALHYAAENGHVDVVEKLLSNKADIHIKTCQHNTPLHHAARNGHLNVVEKLISNNADVNRKNYVGFTPLHKAAENGHADVVEKLITKGADVNINNCNIATPLHYAAENGHIDVIEKLITNKADLNIKDITHGNTPLQYASAHGHVTVAEKLLSNKADVEDTNNYGLTALYCAVKYEKLDVVKKLVEYGANINDMKPPNDISLLERVAKNKEIAEYFAKVKIERQKENDKNIEKANKETHIVSIVKTKDSPNVINFDIIEMVKKAFKERNVAVFKFLIENQKIDKAIVRETFKDEINMITFMEQVKLTNQ